MEEIGGIILIVGAVIFIGLFFLMDLLTTYFYKHKNKGDDNGNDS